LEHDTVPPSGSRPLTRWEDDEYVLSRIHRDGEARLLLRSRFGERPETLARLEHEYELRDVLDPAWATRPLSLVRQDGIDALLLADPGGELLSTLVGRPWELRVFLRVAIGIAEALRQLHKQGIVHKDVKPAHILVDVGTGQAWLTGFSIASRVPRERARPQIIAGSLAYMAPEQTGRMNRSVDSRSDLYAFGVTLYQMLTGELPFTAADATEWIHSHIARAPKPPGERVQGIPAPVEELVLKLLCKTPEHRYQTAAGVEEDLRRCLTELESSGRIPPFPLASQDVPDRLLIPERLYGREREVETLLAAFERGVAKGTPELVLVSGAPGVGKSSVVNELQKSLTVARGLFASGKFDQYKRDIPYATFAQALRSVVRTMLSQSDVELSQWRDSIGRALGPHGQLIANLIPEIELIVGKQPPVPELPPQEAKNRFEMVVRRLIGAIATQEHPLVLFLDDLQWLDAATLDLLEHVVTHAEVRHLLIIGAYRDNEVGEAHALSKTLERIKAAGARVNEMLVAPLDVHDVGRLFADALVCDVERVQPLSHLVHEKTGGNPFFIIQFVAALSDGKLISFDPTHRRWLWDLPGIRARNFTDNIADLMVDRLAKLSLTTRDALKELACLGNSAPTWMLGAARGAADAAVDASLSEALGAGLVVHQGGAYSFLHDRIQEASYALIPEGDRARVHLSIGRALLARTPADKRDDTIFDIVHQLNRGAALLVSPEERREVAGLNLIAGKRARSAAAYVSALGYFNCGAALLPEDSWERCYELVFGIELARAECEYMSGAAAPAEDRLSMLSRRARDRIDLANVVCVQINLFGVTERHQRTVDTCLDYMRQVGIEWSLQATDDEVRREYERLWNEIGDRPIETFLDLPRMSDLECRATMDVLGSLLGVAYATNGNLLALAVLHMTRLSLERGNTDASAIAYSFFGGAILGPRFGRHQEGFRFGQIGVDLVEKRGLDRFRARVWMVFGMSVIPWTRHLRASREIFQRAFRASLDTGDVGYAAYSKFLAITARLGSGDLLDDVQREAESALSFARNVRWVGHIDYLTIQLALVRTLRGLTPRFGFLDDEASDESRFEPVRLAQNQTSSAGWTLGPWWYWIRKLQARFHAGETADALEAASRARQLLPATPNHFELAEFHFYSALSHAAASTRLEPIREHHEQLARWAESCPENFDSREATVAAEIARLEGRELDAERLYERAIRLAREHELVHIEAIGNDLAARFHLDRGYQTIAHAYLRAARRCYLRWGALGKVAQLDERHPGLEEHSPPGPTTTAERLDLATVIEVSQAASGEILLEKLIETVMVHAVEHAGAERGLLILLRDGEPWIEAEATTDQDRVAVSLRHAIARPGELPESMLRYVIRTRESVILDDAATQNLFSADEYIRQKRSRSVLCLPLIIVKPGDRVEKRATLCGVLYLENNLASHVFTPARTAVLKVLASQAAISLDNAHLYADLKAAEEKTRQAERKVRRVVDNIPALVWTASPDGLSNFFGQRWLEYTGLSPEETLGLGWTATIHPDDLEQLQANFQRAKDEGKPAEAEARMRRADGGYRWFLGRCVPLRDGSGQIEGWYGSATDIEDRKQAEQSLRRSEAYLAQAQLLSHTGSFGVRVSPGEIVWSKETFRLLGLDETSKPSLETVLQHTHPEDVALVRRAVEEATQSGAGMDFEHRLVMSDGSIKHVHVIADAVRDESGNLELVGAVQDITSSKNAFEEIRALRDQLYQENVALREEVDKASMFEDIVGSSPPLRAVLSRVSKVAPTDSTAFISGETGTGKELIARAIHRRSPRASRAFVAVNCAIIPKELIASELFGHEKGAFTGALQRRVGRFELAQGGTLFLDEVGEIPLDTQVGLLRVLQERRFERVGGTQSVEIDVRVISATNRDLEAAMNAGSFRRDLFYRLNVFPIQVPSLRERREDIPMLVKYFIDRFATKAGKRFSRIHKKSLNLLQSYDWPGNIRELQNVIERSVILCDTKEFAVDEHWLVPGPAAMEPKKRTLDEQVVGEEKKIIEAALAETGGKVAGPSGAAVTLGMPATTLYSKIKSMKIDKRRFKRS
jgi:PAS domain S-box-containing protein